MSEVNRYARAIAKANAAGDAEAAQYLREQMHALAQTEARTESDPLAGTNWGERALANLGAGFADIGLGVKQLAGRATGEEAREKAALDARLAQSTRGGGAAQFLGAAIPALPLAFVPGANTVAGAALIGGGTAAAMPTQSDNVALGKVGQTAAGALTGGLAQKYLPGAIQYAGRKVSDNATRLADAMARRGLGTAARRQGIAERTFINTVDDPRAALSAIGRHRDVPGTQPTTMQILGERRGLEIERKLRESGGRAAEELGAMRSASNEARYKYLRDELDKSPDQLWTAAREFAEKAKGKMRVMKSGIDPRGTLIREAGRLRNSYDNPRAQGVMQEIQDRLRVALAKAPDEQLDSLHKLRMYEIDDRLEALAGSDRKLSRQLARDLVGFKQALDKRLNEGLRGNASWDEFLTGYSTRAREAGWAESGAKLLDRIDNMTPTSTGTPALTSGRTVLRKEIGAVDDFNNPRYAPLAEDAIGAVDRSLDVEMRPLAPDIRPAGSATGANLNRQTDAALAALEPMLRGTPAEHSSVLSQAAGFGSVAGAVANPAAALGAGAATLAAGKAHSMSADMANRAALDIATRLFSVYRDPQVAVQVLRRAVAAQQVPEALAMQAAQYLTRLGAASAGGVAGANLANVAVE